MRDFKGMTRQRGRNRGSGGGGGGNGKPTQNVNRAFDSNGPDVKIRGHAQHVYDKYCQLARDAASAGDRVLAENYLQHAEHYFRVLRVLQPSRPASDITGRDVFASGFDIDVDEETDQDATWVDEGGEGEADGQRDQMSREQPPREQAYRDQAPRDQGQRDQGRDGYARDNRDNRDNRDRNQSPNQNRDRYEPRDRNRDDRPRDDRPRDAFAHSGDAAHAPDPAGGDPADADRPNPAQRADPADALVCAGASDAAIAGPGPGDGG